MNSNFTCTWSTHEATQQVMLNISCASSTTCDNEMMSMVWDNNAAG